MIKEIKYKGFTATPSDYECPDGELDAAINLVPDNGELEAVRGGEVVISDLEEGDQVMMIHVVNDGKKHLIVKNGTSLYYRTYEDATKHLISTFSTDAFKCSATGNMLCVYN